MRKLQRKDPGRNDGVWVGREGLNLKGLPPVLKYDRTKNAITRVRSHDCTDIFSSEAKLQSLELFLSGINATVATKKRERGRARATKPGLAWFKIKEARVESKHLTCLLAGKPKHTRKHRAERMNACYGVCRHV